MLYYISLWNKNCKDNLSRRSAVGSARGLGP